MFRYFRKAKKIPPFPALETSAYRDMYFFRMAQWRVIGEKSIVVIDPLNPRLLTFDDWPTLVFLAADGQKTIKNYVDFTADRYSDSVPEGLDRTILHQIETLLDYQLIELHMEKRRPNSQFDKPLP